MRIADPRRNLSEVEGHHHRRRRATFVSDYGCTFERQGCPKFRPALVAFQTYSHSLCTQGIDSEFVSLENIISRASEDAYGLNNLSKTEAEGLGQVFYDKVASLFGERIKECGNRVPVVTG